MKQYFAFHSPTKVQHQNLSTEEMKKKILEDTNLTNWLIWHAGMPEWKSASEVEEVKQMVKELSVPPPLPTPPPLPSSMKIDEKDVKKVDDNELVIVDFAEESQQGPVSIPAARPAPAPTAIPAAKQADQKPAATPAQNGKRIHPRIKGRLRTIITNTQRAFITYTRDISLGGVFLEHSIPEELLKSSVDIFITGPSGKDSIVFRCSPVQNQEGQYRFQFAPADQKNFDKLATWLSDLAAGVQTRK